MHTVVDRLEKHLKSSAFSKSAVRNLFSDFEIPDWAFEYPEMFCALLRDN